MQSADGSESEPETHRDELARSTPNPLQHERPGNCLDIAVAESFFHTLKTKRIYHAHYQTRREARLAIFEYIERSSTPGVAARRLTIDHLRSMNE